MPNGIDDFDEYAISTTLKPVKQPVSFGLYRWSMEEDILLLKAVPLMGRMFAEIGKRFIPYRDRGALRKRYQVLERRVKGAMKRDKKMNNDIKSRIVPLKGTASRLPPPPPVNYTNKTIKQLPNVAPSGPYNRLNPSAPGQPYNASGEYYPRPMRNSNVAYPPANNREAVPSTMVSNIHPQPSSDSISSAAIGRVIEGEWSQMGRMIAQDTGTKPRFDERYPQGSAPHPGTDQQYPHHYPSSYNPQYLPQMSFNDGSLSGLSMLGDSAQGELSKNKAPSTSFSANKGETLLNSVKKRTSENTQYPPPTASKVASVGATHDDGVKSFKQLSEAPKPSADADTQPSPPRNQPFNSNLNFSQMGSTIHMSHGFDHSLMAPPELDAISVLNNLHMSNSSIGGIGSSKFTPTPSSPFKPPRNSNLERKSSAKQESIISQTPPPTNKKSSFLDKVKQKVHATSKKK